MVYPQMPILSKCWLSPGCQYTKVIVLLECAEAYQNNTADTSLSKEIINNIVHANCVQV